MVEIVVSPRTQTLPGVPITISGPHTNMTPTVYKGTSGGQQIIVIPQSLLQQSGVSTFLNGTGIVTSSSNVPKKAIIRLSPKSPTMSTTISSSTLSPSIGTKRPLPSSSPDIDSLSSSDDSDMPIRKRANLDHLSPEEKMMRRKLKNRVAAQNARDKKRVKMDEMEFVIKDLQDERMRLESENGRLAALNERLMSENEILRASSTNVLNVDAIKDEMPLSPASLPRSPMPPSLSDQGIVVSRASEPAERTGSRHGSETESGCLDHGSLSPLDASQEGAGQTNLPSQDSIHFKAFGGVTSVNNVNDILVTINACSEDQEADLALEEEDLVGSSAEELESCQDLEDYFRRDLLKEAFEGATKTILDEGPKVVTHPIETCSDIILEKLMVSVDAKESQDHQTLNAGAWEESFEDLFPDLI